MKEIQTTNEQMQATLCELKKKMRFWKMEWGHRLRDECEENKEKRNNLAMYKVMRRKIRSKLQERAGRTITSEQFRQLFLKVFKNKYEK